MEGLEATEILFSTLERTKRIDSEYFKKDLILLEETLVQKQTNMLTELVSISDGNHFSIAESFVEEGVPYYRGQDVTGHHFIELSSPKYISQQAFREPHMLRSHLKKGDVLLSIVGTIGESSLVTSARPATCSCKLAILRPAYIDANVLSVFLQSSYGKKQIERLTRGAVQMGLLLEDMSQVLIPLLTDTFKSVISKLVSLSQKAIEESNLSQQQAELILLNTLGLENWQPTPALSYERKSSEVFAAGRLDAEYFNPITHAILERLEDKGSISLGEICSVTSGYPWLSSTFIDNENPEQGEPFIRIRNCKPGVIESITLDKLETNYAISQNQPKTKLNDLVIGMDGLNWFYASLTEADAYVNQRVAWLSVDDLMYPPEYLMVVINSLIGQKQLLAQMTIAHTVGHITLNDIRGLRIPILTYEARLEIAKQLEQANQMKQQSKERLEVAKRAVEIAIEDSEQQALNYLSGFIGHEQ